MREAKRRVAPKNFASATLLIEPQIQESSETYRRSGMPSAASGHFSFSQLPPDQLAFDAVVRQRQQFLRCHRWRRADCAHRIHSLTVTYLGIGATTPVSGLDAVA